MQGSFSEFAQEVTKKYNLDAVDVYFLDLMPLIEMMWADGEVQDTEIEILMSFADDLMTKIESFDQDHAIEKRDIIRFIERYTNTRPNPKMLAELRDAAIEIANERDDPQSRSDILTYCIDIAAACVAGYPYEENQRVSSEEKILLLKIIGALNISAETKLDLS